MSSDESHVIKEGKAEIIVADKKVFYNPVQEFNRDLRYILFLYCLLQVIKIFKVFVV